MKQKAFTLIELLVVIAIIGVISSIVLVNLKDARERARIAKNLQFDHSIYHSLGAYAVGIWSFDDSMTDGYATDVSGYNNHCQLMGGMDEENNVVKGIMGNGLYFDGENHYLNCGHNPSLNITDKVTITAWAKPESLVEPEKEGHIVDKYYDTYSLFIDAPDSYDTFLTQYRSSGKGCNRTHIEAESTGYFDIRWHHLVAVIDSGGKVSIYVDANLEKSEDFADGSICSRPTRDLRIGAGGGGTLYYFFHGVIDEVRIYNEVLSTAQIQKLYAEGLEKYELALGKF